MACPHCGASNPWEANVCLLCRAPLVRHPDFEVEAETGPETVAKEERTPNAGTALLGLKLGTVLLCMAAVVTLLGIWVVASLTAVWYESPQVVILCAKILIPAMLFTATAWGWRRHQRRSMTAVTTATVFIISVVVTTGVFVVFFVAPEIAFLVELWRIFPREGHD